MADGIMTQAEESKLRKLRNRLTSIELGTELPNPVVTRYHLFQLQNIGEQKFLVSREVAL